MKVFLLFFTLSFSVSAIEPEFKAIEVLLKNIHFEEIDQSRYSLAKKGEAGETIYPKCRKIFNVIYRQYEGPHIVQKFYEGSLFTHRRVWKNKKRSLSLRCFEKNGNRYAERISIYET